MHIQPTLQTKLFCPCSVSADEENRNVCPICLGYPGTKPLLSKESVKKALLFAKFLNMRLPKSIRFDRKTYFYPDLPKSFQITQYNHPFGTNGFYEMYNGKKVDIVDFHMEEDPASLKYEYRDGKKRTLIDFNRSGKCLFEIVTSPCLRSVSETRIFIRDVLEDAKEVIGINFSSESWRCDCNISFKGHARTELKNLNGLAYIEKALTTEITDQIKNGFATRVYTKYFDIQNNKTIISREKEGQGDYMFIPENNLGNIDISSLVSEANGININPPSFFRKSLRETGFNDSQSRQITLTGVKYIILDLIEKCSVQQVISNLSVLMKFSKEILEKNSLKIIDILNSSEEIFLKHIKLKEILSGQNITKSDRSLDDILKMVLDKNPKFLENYKKDPKAVNFFIGQCMRETKGKYSIKEINKFLRNK